VFYYPAHTLFSRLFVISYARLAYKYVLATFFARFSDSSGEAGFYECLAITGSFALLFCPIRFWLSALVRT